MDRHWFFTWRTSGTWLPGQSGFVGFYVTPHGQRVTDNAYGGPTAEPMPPLADYARCVQLAPAVYLSAVRSKAVCAQLLETAGYREREMDALARMSDHVHIVFGVAGDPDPDEMLADWKAYASRALNRLAPADPDPQRRDGRSRRRRAARPRWWAEGGSTRPLKTPDARIGAIRYVRGQENPLAVWPSDEAQRLLGD